MARFKAKASERSFLVVEHWPRGSIDRRPKSFMDHYPNLFGGQVFFIF